MKRKQAMACNAPGPTCNYLSMAQANAMQNGGYPAQAIESFEVFKGIDFPSCETRAASVQRYCRELGGIPMWNAFGLEFMI